VKRAPGRNDVELFLVVLFWAFNVTVVKLALREMEPLAFNVIRFLCAAAVLLVATRVTEGSLGVRRRDVGRVVLLGVVGHTFYQICFVHGLARTTASSAALIFGSTPVVVAILSRLAGHERIGLAGGVGAAAAFYGVSLIVRGTASAQPAAPGGGGEALGDILILVAVLCWSTYTVLSRDLLTRYSPLRITTLTLAIGTLLLVPASAPDLLDQDWDGVSWMTWIGLAYSFTFALVISYVLWYRSVRKVGNLKTAIYSNLVPVFGTLFGVALLGDRITPGLWAGAGLILSGIVLTRLSGGAAVAPTRSSDVS